MPLCLLAYNARITQQLKGRTMTESLINPIKLGKESNALIAKAFSKENLQKVRAFEKEVRPTIRQTADYKPKLSIDEIMKAVNDAK